MRGASLERSSTFPDGGQQEPAGTGALGDWDVLAHSRTVVNRSCKEQGSADEEGF